MEWARVPFYSINSCFVRITTGSLFITSYWREIRIFIFQTSDPRDQEDVVMSMLMSLHGLEGVDNSQETIDLLWEVWLMNHTDRRKKMFAFFVIVYLNW